jgi:hypothetical protein
MSAFSTPLVDCFRQGDAPRDVRLMAARGGLALHPETQLSLLMLLASDADPEVVAAAEATIARLPRDQVAAVLAVPEAPAELREFFRARGDEAAVPSPAAEAAPGHGVDLLLEAREPSEPVAAPDAMGETSAPGTDSAEAASDGGAGPVRQGPAQRLAMLTVAERMKVGMQGNREERQILVRDPNRLVSSAVLSSPKLTESEVEAIARMTNVSTDVLRSIGTSRVWLKNYAVVAALTRNAKTPIAVALSLLNRLTERDIRFLATDRNIPEPVRLAARKNYSHSVARRQ